ncbi:cytochrome P450 [Mycobacterium sp. SMC-4]|uniref:cytochrome P450 n=1 Tax=Mycobacterium sp. SMC-4 TaxID=2857059 RepID=UPI0021B24E69|nr:cytochrome P450 [Mycobacterium sp. SMC-4]UXA18270.1 cytochrome P450 [Mycobacterium sp. SMC-4]
MSRPAPRLTGIEAALTLADLGLPSIAAGAIARRRSVTGLLDRWQADARGVARLHKLRERYGRGPVEVAVPGRHIVVPLDPADVGTVLDRAPSPFHPASWEKRHALEQFQPRGVLVSRGEIRRHRRAYNEAVLEIDAELHTLAEPMNRTIVRHAETFAKAVLAAEEFDSARFTVAWWRLVRRVVLGADAEDDDAITDDLWRLRKAGNWSFASLPHQRRRDRFFERLYGYAETPDPDSLLGALVRTPAHGAVDPVGQVPHWLFAFDAAGMASLRALALLTTHPEALARCEVDDPDSVAVRPFLRACVLESVRLWPTTPAILREVTTTTTWHEGTAEQVSVSPPASVLIPVPAFHRDPDLLDFADEFAPDIWLDGRARSHPQLVPFSAGPGECPGRNVVLFTTSSFLAAVLAQAHLTLESGQSLAPGRRLPATLNQFGLSFSARPRQDLGRPVAPLTAPPA